MSKICSDPSVESGTLSVRNKITQLRKEESAIFGIEAYSFLLFLPGASQRKNCLFADEESMFLC